MVASSTDALACMVMEEATVCGLAQPGELSQEKYPMNIIRLQDNSISFLNMRKVAAMDKEVIPAAPS
ncbi:hypothetical protein Brsp01_34360 [Brucella sp. NBRC 12950]|nr:hypothetical protein Brsp01_34360 [Brucella sp. NBRC 12950]